MSLKDLAGQSKKNNLSTLDRLRKWLVKEEFNKCSEKQLAKVPHLLYSFTRENEVWRLEFCSTTLYVQLAKDNVLVANTSANIFFRCSSDLAQITKTITNAAYMIAEQENLNQNADI